MKLTHKSLFTMLIKASALLMLLIASGSVGAYSDGASEVVQGSKAATLEACVRDTDDMRRNHMDYLKHKRDLTMRKGIRTEDLSLSQCVACHAGTDTHGAYVPVTEEGQFCESCHSRVGQTLDCFQCHRTTPDSRNTN